MHVIGPELGVTQPGMTIVCGDSHTATHGAFGALAFGIGTSEVEHVLATQCLVQKQAALDADPLRGRAGVRRHRQGPDPRDDRPDRRRRRGRARRRVQRPGDQRAVDGGPHDGLQHDDRGGRPRRHGRARRRHLRVVRARRAARLRARARSSRGRSRGGASLRSDAGADVRPRGAWSTSAAISPQVTWGTNPGMVVGVADRVPSPDDFAGAGRSRRGRARAALTWSSSRGLRSRRSGSTACSSARAPTRGSATCAPRRR